MTITINGSGTITGITAGGLPDATIQQADLAANVAGNGPAFLVTISAIQTISANTWTKLTFNSESFDTNSNFDPTTNYRFTPTVAGYYQLNAQVQFLGSGINANMGIYKNGSLLILGCTTPTGGGAASQVQTVAVLLQANGSTDYFEIYGFSGGTQINAGLSGANFSGFLARAN